MFEQFNVMLHTVMSVAALVAALPAFVSSQVPIGKDAAYGMLMLAIGGVSATVVRMLVGGVLREAQSSWRMLAHTAGISGLMIMALIAPDELLLGVGISGAVIYVLLETLMPHQIAEETGIESTASRDHGVQTSPIREAGMQPVPLSRPAATRRKAA